jgi:hypothetical protein
MGHMNTGIMYTSDNIDGYQAGGLVRTKTWLSFCSDLLCFQILLNAVRCLDHSVSKDIAWPCKHMDERSSFTECTESVPQTVHLVNSSMKGKSPCWGNICLGLALLNGYEFCSIYIITCFDMNLFRNVFYILCPCLHMLV